MLSKTAERGLSREVGIGSRVDGDARPRLDQPQ